MELKNQLSFFRTATINCNGLILLRQVYHTFYIGGPEVSIFLDAISLCIGIEKLIDLGMSNGLYNKILNLLG